MIDDKVDRLHEALLPSGAAAEAQKAAGKPLSADQIALAIQDHKAANVETNFKKSPDAWEGVRGRIADERKVFEKK